MSGRTSKYIAVASGILWREALLAVAAARAATVLRINGILGNESGFDDDRYTNDDSDDNGTDDHGAGKFLSFYFLGFELPTAFFIAVALAALAAEGAIEAC